ncbi:MAG: hypothetical protein ACR2P1_12510 [Pseudomonadales bacterium]
MISELQNHLSDIYKVDPGYDVADFLITDPRVAGALGGDGLLANTEETVLLQEDSDGLAISVFLDSELLTRLQAHDPLRLLTANQLKDLWTVLEGISHFSYLAWSARKNRRVSLLELEMQAEIDKFVSALFLAVDQEDSELVDNMHHRLFDEIDFHNDLDDDQRERYAVANAYAARFCHGLRNRIANDSDLGLQELRRYYRMSQCDKISHIHSHAF